MKKLIAIVLFPILIFQCCKQTPDNGDDTRTPAPSNEYELSYWVDMDLIGDHLRGYWYNASDPAYPAIGKTEDIWIENACKSLKEKYHGDKLYVIYHRQYEQDIAREVFMSWKKHGETYGLEVVPCIVLESYDTEPEMNFTDEEIIGLCKWSLENIHPEEFAIYDVWVRDQAGTPQDIQIKAIAAACGDVLVKVGHQPLLELNDYFVSAVQDCWTAECQGRTNELWENPVYYNGSYEYGRRLLEKWVSDRVENDGRRWSYCLIPVAWDYDVNLDKPSYDCPGDNALTNDPPVPGRVTLCADSIISCYDGGIANAKFGGLSCDLHILHANSAGCGKDNPDFYTALRTGADYDGYFGEAIDEIGGVFKKMTR